jgi:hypothetical protein
MKQTNLSLTGIVFGIFLTFGAWFRWFILFPDFDKAFFYGLLGIMVIAISWNYAGRVSLAREIKKLENVLTLVEDYIHDKVEKREK